MTEARAKKRASPTLGEARWVVQSIAHSMHRSKCRWSQRLISPEARAVLRRLGPAWSAHLIEAAWSIPPAWWTTPLDSEGEGAGEALDFGKRQAARVMTHLEKRAREFNQDGTIRQIHDDGRPM